MAGMAELVPVSLLITLQFPEHLVDRLRAVSPRLKIHVHPVRSASEIPTGLLMDVEILYTSKVLPEPEAVPNLRWIQFHFAGIDHVAEAPLVRSGVAVTTLSGAAVSQMVEFALMAILAMGRRLPLMMSDKAQKHWAEDRFDRFEPKELRGSTVGIIGYGSVGREVARVCRAMGAKVLATKRDLKRLEDTGYMPEGQGDQGAEIVERLYPPQALRSMASLCDFLVVTVPLTVETRGIVDKRVLLSLKPASFLIDLSRGGVVDHGALIEVLNENRLAGAALDVYPLEPLPESSPLWGMPNVILSPHVAGASKEYSERATELFVENLHRYLADQPLLNRFDPQRGY
ncbi:MAG TPA: D-2-hydroxyacid dehydrogenase [Anaerolineales bacterium]|nr:D-2-hydroxyacid dehydrogenase [Anaerolineales bacterium]